jgi:hypothetical protein
LITVRQLMGVLVVKAAPNGAFLYMQLVRCFKLMWSNAVGHVLVCGELTGRDHLHLLAPSFAPVFVGGWTGGIGRRICAVDKRTKAVIEHSKTDLRPSPPPKAPVSSRQAMWTCSWWRMLRTGVAIDVQLGGCWRTRVLQPSPLSPRLERGCTRRTRRGIATSLLQTLSGMALREASGMASPEAPPTLKPILVSP